MILELQYIIAFSIFVVLQSLAINGWHECFAEGNVFNKLFGSFLLKHKGKWWTMPLWGCVKCEASVMGSITFWFTVLPLFGFNFYELWGWFIDMFILVGLNWYFYKKI